MAGKMCRLHQHAGTMPITFHVTYKNVELLFTGLVINSAQAMAAAFVAVFLLAMGYEALKRVREGLQHVASEGLHVQLVPVPGPNRTRLVAVPQSAQPQQLGPGLWVQMALHVLQTALHVLQVLLGHLLMLTAMTHNAYLGLAVVTGAGTGHWLFGWKQAKGVGSRNLGMVELNVIGSRNGPRLFWSSSSLRPELCSPDNLPSQNLAPLAPGLVSDILRERMSSTVTDLM